MNLNARIFVLVRCSSLSDFGVPLVEALAVIEAQNVYTLDLFVAISRALIPHVVEIEIGRRINDEQKKAI